MEATKLDDVIQESSKKGDSTEPSSDLAEDIYGIIYAAH